MNSFMVKEVGKKWSILIILLLTTLAINSYANCALRMPHVFGNHMVLQADKNINCWGWSRAGDSVQVKFIGDDGKTRTHAVGNANAEGKWSTTLPKMPANTTGKLVITSKTGASLEFCDILVGEVWLASGQSNMTFPIIRSSTAEEALLAANQLHVRIFVTARESAPTPQEDVAGSWVVSSPETVRSLPAVAWYFATFLHRQLDRPVGVIVSAWGGTPIETWLEPKIMAQFPEDAEALQKAYERAVQEEPKILAVYQKNLSAWETANPTAALKTQNAASKPASPNTSRIQNLASRCYNGMIHGLNPFTLRGILWYQGESNASRPEKYAALAPELLISWRKIFQDPELPFLYVELPNYKAANVKLVGGWAQIRESQASVLALPNTGVVCTIDVGDPDDVHPTNKRPVGERLAWLALSDVYGRNDAFKSPQLSNFAIEGNTVRISLDNADGLQMGKDKNSTFEIRGHLGKWLPAEVRIDNNQLILWNDSLPAPVAARHAWQSNPTVTVRNSAGLPLRPFRTDHQNINKAVQMD